MAFDILIADDGDVKTIQHTDSFSLVTDEITAMAGYSDIGKMQHDIIMLTMTLAQRSLEIALDREVEETEENNSRVCVIAALLCANMAANIIDKRSHMDGRYEKYADEFAEMADKLFNNMIDEIGIDMKFMMITEEQRNRIIGEILMRELEETEESHGE